MLPFRFVHAADLHLDSPFLGLSAVNQKVAKRLKEATFAAFDNIVGACLDFQADFLVVAGDVYDSQDRSLRAQLYFRDAVRKLSEHGVHVFVAHGNHDPLDGWSARIQWPQGVQIFGGSSVECVTVQRDGQVLAHIYGISYPTREVRQNLASSFQPRPGGSFAIGVLHCNVGANTGHEPYAPCTVEDLLSIGVDYWALGHVHVPMVIHSSRPTVVYAGSSQGRSPRETGERGCYVVEVDPDGIVTPRFISTDLVRWYCESINIEHIRDEEHLVDEMERLCETVRQQADGRDAICRIMVKGRGPMHNSLRRPGFADDLIERIRGVFGEQDPFVWVESFEAVTRPPVDVDTLRKGQDFTGDLLRLSDELRKNAGGLEALRQALLPLYSCPGGRRFLANPTDEEILAWLESAQAHCLDLLVEEEN